MVLAIVRSRSSIWTPAGMFRDAVISILATVAKQERVRLMKSSRAVQLQGLERQRERKMSRAGRPRVFCDRERVLALHGDGLSLGKIAVELALSKTSVSRIVAVVSGVARRNEPTSTLAATSRWALCDEPLLTGLDLPQVHIR